ncbi:transposase family protein [Cyanobacteria bacterium FACHB-471]|nr:transposase family protein [Cyanobacteria bacterium FACHB-471]
MDLYLDTLLNLPNVTVEICSQVEDCIYLQLKFLNSGISCPACSNYTDGLRQARPILIRDLPAFGKRVYLKIPHRQFYCSKCQRYRMERLEFVDWKQHHTYRYQEYIYQKIKAFIVQQIVQEEQLSFEEVKSIFDHLSKEKKKGTVN